MDASQIRSASAIRGVATPNESCPPPPPWEYPAPLPPVPVQPPLWEDPANPRDPFGLYDGSGNPIYGG